MADGQELDSEGSSDIKAYGPTIAGQNAPIPAGRLDTVGTKGFTVKGNQSGGWRVSDQDKLPSKNLSWRGGL